jgi:hypothetical protein
MSGTAANGSSATGETAAPDSAKGPEEHWLKGVDRLRDVTKWLITAFAGAGAVLVGTAPLAGIGKVSGAGRIAAVVIGGLVALGSILWTIYQASRVLTPEYTTFQELEGLAPLRQLVEEEERDAFLGRWGNTLADFKARRDDEWAALYGLLELQPTTDTDRQALQPAPAEQQREIAELEAYARQLLATGTYFEVLERFKQARTHMLYGALVATLVSCA